MNAKGAQDPKLFHKPLHGLLNGRPVRILGTGDVEGNSPSYLVINEQGQSSWESFANVTVIDTDCAPMSQQYIENMQNTFATTGSTTGGTSRSSSSR
jgi:hypothetical protein